MNVTLFGIPVRWSWTTGILAAFFGINFFDYLTTVDGSSSARIAALAATVGVVVATITGLILHELGHALMARRFGIATSDIRVFAFGGVAALNGRPETPGSQALIAVAGPAVSGALAAAFGVGASFVQTGALATALWWLFWVNLSLAVFNLLPGLPLDGGHLVSAWAWRRSGNETHGRMVGARFGKGVGTALMAVGGVAFVLGTGMALWTVALGWFIRRRAQAEIRLINGETLADRLSAAASRLWGEKPGFGGTGGQGNVGRPRVGSADLGFGEYESPFSGSSDSGSQRTGTPRTGTPRTENQRVRVEPIEVKIVE